MKLIPNRFWTNEDESSLPAVVFHFLKDSHFLTLRFQVAEPRECFAANVERDGGKAWEDSCVELFVRALDSETDYINFEFTSKGFCYAARGRDREHRKEFLQTQYARILRTVNAPIFDGNTVSWEIKVSIPAFLLGAKSLSGAEIFGNVYKCGDKTGKPHHLLRFPITTEKPDFHQPRFFRKLL